MHRRQPRLDPFRGAPIFVAARRRPNWTRLPAPAGLSLVVVGIALAIAGLEKVWWLVVAAGLVLALLSLFGESIGEHVRWRGR